MGKILECKDITVSYENFTAVQGLSFELYSGDYLCVVGENGSGKSSLIKGILGLLPLRSGEVVLGGGLRRSDIGYLPQQSLAQRDFPATVGEVVRSGCLNRGFRPFYSGRDTARADEAARRLGIEGLMKKSYRELSGGQQQRVLLARALCAAKGLLLLDEPVTGLDPVVTAEFYKLIEKLNRDTGIAVIMVSHDIASAVKSAGKILHMGTGGAEFFGEVGDYLKSKAGRRFAGEGEDDA